jgi:hypothetical protein
LAFILSGALVLLLALLIWPSAWEVSSAIRGLRAEMLICGILACLAMSDRESPPRLTRSGT